MYRKLGRIPDKLDTRDLKLSFKKLLPIETVYLNHKYRFPAVYDQGNLGSCTANALSFLIDFDLINKNDQNKVSAFYPSRLFIYYYERVLEGTVNTDSGAEIRDGIKVLANYGVPNETSWPYDVDQFTTTPSEASVKEALNFQAVVYQSVDGTNKQLLVNTLMNGYPIAYGMTAYESFVSNAVADSGIVPMPMGREQIVGGHAIAIVGYDTRWDSFIVRNSWGSSWGQGGYFRIPAAYITDPNLCSDFWTINLIK